jgi:hypothetical protein
MVNSSFFQRWLPIGATFAFSFANFLAAYILQYQGNAHSFGVFALTTVIGQFGISLINALSCAPLTVELNSDGGEKNFGSIIGGFTSGTFLLIFLCSLLTAYCVYLLKANAISTLFGSIYCVLLWLRWYCRSISLSLHHFNEPKVSDLLYALVTFVGLFGLHATNSISLNSVYCSQIVSLAISLFPHRTATVYLQIEGFAGNLRKHARSIKQHGRWALLGVISTEGTSNAHVWIVGFLFGAQAFAPIAAITLFFRPSQVLINALTQYERSKMSKAIFANDFVRLHSLRSLFLAITVIAAALNGVGAIVILTTFPKIILNGEVSTSTLLTIAVSLSLIALTRSFRGAESLALQAGGHFRRLALFTTWTAPVAVLFVCISAIAMPHNLGITLTGVLLAEFCACLLIRREFHMVFNKRADL